MRPFPNYDISPNTPEAYEEYLNDQERDDEEEPEDDDKRTLAMLVGLLCLVFGGFNALAAETLHHVNPFPKQRVSLNIEWVKFDPHDRNVCSDLKRARLRHVCGHFKIL